MFHSRLEMKSVSRRKRLHREGVIGNTPRKDEPCAFLYLKALILFFVCFKCKVTTLADYQILFDLRVFVQKYNHTSPRSPYRPLLTLDDPIEKLGKERGCTRGRLAELLIPEPTRFPAIT